MDNISINKNKFIFALITSIYFIYYCFSFTEWHFIDYINIIIHEAGHTIFMFFGDFIHVISGSFFQITFPCIFIFYFYNKKDYFSASLLLFWVGQNLINVSLYVSDAIAMQLPLLGGDSAIHDWNNILERLNLLKYTEKIGSSIYILGVTIIIIAISFSLFYSFNKKEDFTKNY